MSAVSRRRPASASRRRGAALPALRSAVLPLVLSLLLANNHYHITDTTTIIIIIIVMILLLIIMITTRPARAPARDAEELRAVEVVDHLNLVSSPTPSLNPKTPKPQTLSSIL